MKVTPQNHQRVYSEEQVERVQLIAETIQVQRAKGIKQTDFEEVEAKLLDRFGGEVKRIETDLVVPPQSLNQIVELRWARARKSASCSNSCNNSQNNNYRIR